MTAGTIEPLPPELLDQATGRGGDPEIGWREMLATIEDAIVNDPRSLQTRIGPSGIGNPCDRCLAMALAEVPQKRDAAWLPTIGRATHAWLEDTFNAANERLGTVRWLTELRVDVGEIDGVPITGSLDVYDIVTATCTDWKIVGASTLESARNGPTPSYRVQGHAYGRGITRRGYPCDHVRVAYLPRNNFSLSSAVIWSEPYDESIAVAALTRATGLASTIRLIRAGGGDVAAWIHTLPTQRGCYDCARYPNPDGTYPPARGQKPDALHDLINA